MKGHGSIAVSGIRHLTLRLEDGYVLDADPTVGQLRQKHGNDRSALPILAHAKRDFASMATCRRFTRSSELATNART